MPSNHFDQVLPCGADFSVQTVRFAGAGEPTVWSGRLSLRAVVPADTIGDAREKLLDLLLPMVERLQTELAAVTRQPEPPGPDGEQLARRTLLSP
jgi:hypothetical protein